MRRPATVIPALLLGLALTSPANAQASTEFKLTASLVDARAGVVIDITDDGDGVHTLTRKTQPRYTNNGIVVLDQRPIDVAATIVNKPMAGTLVYA